MAMVAATRFGSTWDSLDRAVSALRARASAAGVDLESASPVDRAAAVIAADAWMRVHDTDTLETPIRFGRAAVAALAAILARAAGQATNHAAAAWPAGSDAGVHVEAVEFYWQWADVNTPDPGEVLARASADLAAAGAASAVASVAALLATHAEIAILDY